LKCEYNSPKQNLFSKGTFKTGVKFSHKLYAISGSLEQRIVMRKTKIITVLPLVDALLENTAQSSFHIVLRAVYGKAILLEHSNFETLDRDVRL